MMETWKKKPKESRLFFLVSQRQKGTHLNDDQFDDVGSGRQRLEGREEVDAGQRGQRRVVDVEEAPDEAVALLDEPQVVDVVADQAPDLKFHPDEISS